MTFLKRIFGLFRRKKAKPSSNRDSTIYPMF